VNDAPPNGTLANLRDLGGLPATGGRRLRSGSLYRSGALSELTSDEVAQIGRLGLRACCDLRSVAERQRAPSCWPTAQVPRLLERPVDVDIRLLDMRALEQLRRQPDSSGAIGLMRNIYRGLPAGCAPVLRELFALLVQDTDSSLPLLVHCTAGKDRTGFVVALLLRALEVDADAILADYLHSNACIDRRRLDGKIGVLLTGLLGSAPSRAVLDVVNGVRADYLESAWEELRRQHGSTEAYLAIAGGLDERQRQRLQDRLLHSEPIR